MDVASGGVNFFYGPRTSMTRYESAEFAITKDRLQHKLIGVYANIVEGVSKCFCVYSRTRDFGIAAESLGAGSGAGNGEDPKLKLAA